MRGCLLQFVCLTTTALQLSSNNRKQDVEEDLLSEFCGYERLSLKCSVDEGLMVRGALYGRMKSGRCITAEYAHAMGCYADVTSFLSGLCSGRQNCSLLVATIDSVAQPCAKDFKSYLEVAYRCIRGKRNIKVLCLRGMHNSSRALQDAWFLSKEVKLEAVDNF